jgi:hypothetical protein
MVAHNMRILHFPLPRVASKVLIWVLSFDLSLVLILVSCLGLVGPVGLGLVGLGLNRRGDI